MIRLGIMGRETATTTIDGVIAEAKALQLDAVDLHLAGMRQHYHQYHPCLNQVFH